MYHRIINWIYFKNSELLAFMINNQYPFQINNGVIRFELDLFKYISLDDILVDFRKNQYIQITQKFLDQVSGSLQQLIQHLNYNNLQYFILKTDQIFIEIKDGQFKQIVLTQLTKTKQEYSMDINKLIPTKSWYQVAWIRNNIELSDLFQKYYQETIDFIEAMTKQLVFPFMKILIQQLHAYVFKELINSSFDCDKIQTLFDFYFTNFVSENITEEILDDFMNQVYNLEKFNDINYIIRLIFLQEIIPYSNIYRIQQKRTMIQQEQIGLRQNVNDQQFILQLVDQISQVVKFDKEKMTKELLTFKCDGTDNDQKLALLNEFQFRIDNIIKKELAQIQ